MDSPADSVADYSGVPDYIIWLTWTFVVNAPHVARQDTTSIPDLDSEDLLEELMLDSQISFAPGLADVLQAASPPSLSYFKSLPTDIKKRWGIHILVLEKPQCRPKIYVDSGTHSTKGLAGRWDSYDKGADLPVNVKEALGKRWTITHKGLLCWCPMPGIRSANRFPTRYLCLILETAFSSVFWAMASKTDDYRIPRLCPWPLQILEYDGCCSHAAIFEGLREGGAAGLSLRERDEYYATMAQRQSDAKKEAYYAFKREDFPGWQAKRRLYDSRRDPEEKKATAKKVGANNRAKRKYACDVCDIAFPSQGNLDAHYATQKHFDKVNGIAPPPPANEGTLWRMQNVAARKFVCNICNSVFGGQCFLERHYTSQKHIKAAAAAAEAVAETETTTDMIVVHSSAMDTVSRSDMDIDSPPDMDIDSPSDMDIDSPPDLEVQCRVVDLDSVVRLVSTLSDEDITAARAATRQSVRAREAANLEAKRYHCEPCDTGFPTAFQLDRHKTTKKHIDAAAGVAPIPDDVRKASTAAKKKQSTAKREAATLAARKCYCSLCDANFKNKYPLDRHKKTPKHINAVAATSAASSI